MKVGINGYGRIGRIVHRISLQRKDIEIAWGNGPRCCLQTQTRQEWACIVRRLSGRAGKESR